MKTLKTIDLTKERELLGELNGLRDTVNAKARELEDMLKPKAAEYYGPEGYRAFLKANSHTVTTDDGYTVSVDEYKIHIEKSIGNGTLTGSGTIYDLHYSDLTFYLNYDSGRYTNGNARKYADIRVRMQELQRDEMVMDPFKDFMATHLLHSIT